MPSAADDCWRLSADCSHWAEESRDNAARLAFRQMATAWAGLAFSQDFILPTDEQVDPTNSESSHADPAENTASSHTENEKIVPVSNAEVDAGRHEQTTRGSTNNSSGQRERLSLPSPTPFILSTDEQVDPTSSESSQATPAENTVWSHTENEKIVPVSNAEVDADRQEQTTRASTNNSSKQHERLSLPSPIPFIVDPASSESSQAAAAENTASSHTENEKIVPVSNAEVDAERQEQTTRASTNNSSEQRKRLSHEQTTRGSTNNSSGQRERLSLPSPTPFPKR
jgi:hypothetical protein